MIIIDANIILRYLLKDNMNMHIKAVNIIDKQQLFVPNEIAAEIVYVLEKVYRVPKKEIAVVLTLLFKRKNFDFVDKELVLTSLNFYIEHNLDYADALLISYHKINKAEIITFDKRINQILKII